MNRPLPVAGAPLACDAAALGAAEHARRTAALATVRAAARRVRELPDGYAFELAPDAATVLAAVEFMALERRCCPFFAFALEVEPAGGPAWLVIRGPEGVKAFLEAEGIAASPS